MMVSQGIILYYLRVVRSTRLLSNTFLLCKKYYFSFFSRLESSLPYLFCIVFSRSRSRSILWAFAMQITEKSTSASSSPSSSIFSHSLGGLFPCRMFTALATSQTSSVSCPNILWGGKYPTLYCEIQSFTCSCTCFSDIIIFDKVNIILKYR